MRVKWGYGLVILFSFTLLTSCAGFPRLKPGAAAVKVSAQVPPKNCRSLGEVNATYNNATDADGKWIISTSQMRAYGKILLQNAAYAKKANYIYLTQETGEMSGIETDPIVRLYLAGEMYSCH